MKNGWKMAKLSVIIPSRDPRFLQKTVDDLLLRAEGDVEVIVVLDGYWPDPMIKNHPKVIIIHQGAPGQSKGMREGINAGMAIAQGEYVIKIDEHCMVDQGYDVKLAADCEDNWVVVPRRYRLDPEKWEIIEDGRPPIDYMYVEYPYLKPYDVTQGLHGNEWKQKHLDQLDVPIDDLMTFQGSCYFMSKKHWDWLGGLDSDLYGPFTHESQEISNKTWLGGGQVKVNKNTWYAHLHKGKKYGTGYGFSTQQWKDFAVAQERGRVACIDHWVNNREPNMVHDFEWLINKFMPMPYWKDTWKEDIIKDKDKDYSTLRYTDSPWLVGLRKEQDA